MNLTKPDLERILDRLPANPRQLPGWFWQLWRLFLWACAVAYVVGLGALIAQAV